MNRVYTRVAVASLAGTPPPSAQALAHSVDPIATDLPSRLFTDTPRKTMAPAGIDTALGYAGSMQSLGSPDIATFEAEGFTP